MLSKMRLPGVEPSAERLQTPADSRAEGPRFFNFCSHVRLGDVSHSINNKLQPAGMLLMQIDVQNKSSKWCEFF
jgi:hypothetical protein